MSYRTILVLSALLVGWRTSSADVVHTFDFRSSPSVFVNETSITFSALRLEENGVTFDAHLTVTATDGRTPADARIGSVGASTLVHQSPSGLGVDPSIFETLTSDESLLFSLATSGATGGDVSINGFPSIAFTGLSSPERALIFLADGTSTNPATPALTVTGSSSSLNGLGNAESFRLFADTTSTNFPANFYVNRLQASFSVTAVPEPVDIHSLFPHVHRSRSQASQKLFEASKLSAVVSQDRMTLATNWLA